MNVAGIICEYNPIHNGHVRHITETRRAVGRDAGIVCAMSGNFVQRGDLAVFSKTARAKAAVLCGADLVIELPDTASLSSAEGFARQGVALLEAAGVCTHISFGSESGSISELVSAANSLYMTEQEGYIKEELARGVTYAAARQAALRRTDPAAARLISYPNNILAVEYIRALERLDSKMAPVTVRRTGAGHDSAAGESSSSIREDLTAGRSVRGRMPARALRVFEEEKAAGRGPVSMTAWETAVLAKLRGMSTEEFSALPDLSEGLENRLIKYARSCPTLAELFERTKTKRYTMSRIRRLVRCACLGITAEDAEIPPQYIRVLAVGQKGREILRQMSRTADLPVITRPAAGKKLAGAAADQFRRAVLGTDLYSLAYPDPAQRTGGRELTESPFVLKQE